MSDRSHRNQTSGTTARTDTEQAPLQYKTNGELRAEIAYAVGGDPSRYEPGSETGLPKATVRRVAIAVQPPASSVDVHAMDLAELYATVCKWVGGEYEPNAGSVWGINRDNLKRIHRAVDGRDPRLVTDGGTSSEQVRACRSCDSTNLKRRSPLSAFSPYGPDDPRYKCSECGHEMHEPVRRPRYPTGTEHESIRALVTADPDDLVTDGGTDSWEPTRAELRDPSEADVSAHARRNLEQLYEHALDGDVDVLDARRYQEMVERYERGAKP